MNEVRTVPNQTLGEEVTGTDSYTTTEVVEKDGGTGFNIPANSQGVFISGILALLVAIVIFAFVVKTNRTFKNKFLGWYKEFLNFRSILIENILKFLYLFLSFFITFVSFTLIKESFIEFLSLLIVGNLALRILFELTLMIIIIWKNGSDLVKYTERLSNKFTKEEKEEVEEKKEEPPTPPTPPTSNKTDQFI